jgi:Fur family ferric uptake transcriptional regulator
MKTFENEVTQRLHTRGGRMTPQRRLILEALDCLGGHPNAEQIFDLARQRDPGLNLSTVYRTLRWLEQEGLVSARHFDETGRHDHFDPALPAEHYHFVCKVCERVIEFDDPAFETVKAQFEQKQNVKVETVSVMFYGVCQACRKAL